jgi:hypothetical protein
MIEVLKQMVEALEVDAYVYNGEKSWAAIQAGKQAIAELESQEPFGIWHQGATDEESDFYLYSESGDVSCHNCIKLYTTPPQRTWVGLTESDRKEIERQSVYVDGAIRMTEAKLKEKNT